MTEFREYAQWISELASDDDYQYVVFGEAETVGRIDYWVQAAEMQALFTLHAVPTLGKGIYIFSSSSGQLNEPWSAHALIEALQSASRAGFQRIKMDKVAEAMDTNGPYRIRFGYDSPDGLTEQAHVNVEPPGDDSAPEDPEEKVVAILERLASIVGDLVDYVRK